MKLKCFYIIILVCAAGITNGQKIDSLSFAKKSEYEFSGTFSAYTAIFDEQDKPYVYVATNELGLLIFDVSDKLSPVPAGTLATAQFAKQKVMNVSQNGNYLYLALGNFFGLSPQNPGLAIVDVSNPDKPVIRDIWTGTDFKQGCAIAITDGQYAYLGAMEEGVIILDISDKQNIQFISRIKPDPNFPKKPGVFSTPNARGMAVRNDTLFLCNDAGGIRMIDLSDRTNPKEIGKYMNAALDKIAQPAYNNIVLHGRYAYAAVDYCGVDVIDISDTAMKSVHWFNPWNCDSSNWQDRPGHTNQLVMSGDSILFVSGAETEVVALDIRDKANPNLIGTYGQHKDSMVTWGIDVKGKQLVLANVDSPFGVPYFSDFGGIQLLEWEAVYSTGGDPGFNETDAVFKIYPNPVIDLLNVEYAVETHSLVRVELFNSLGQLIKEKQLGYKTPGQYRETLSLKKLSKGLYSIKITLGTQVTTLRGIKVVR